MRRKHKIRAFLAAGVLIGAGAGAAPCARAAIVAPRSAQSAEAIAPRAAPRLTLAHLDEQNLPPAELPPGAAQGQWMRVPNPVATVAPATGLSGEPSGPPGDASASPAPSPANDTATTGVSAAPVATAGAPAAAASPDAPGLANAANPANPANPADSAATTAGANPPNQPSSAGADQPGTEAANNPVEPPPALDISTITTGPDPGAQPLAAEIKQADTPALAASLRITEQARRELTDGRTDAAMRTLARAVSIDPGNPYAYFFLGRAYASRHDFAEALTFFRRAEIGFGGSPPWLGETIGYEGACEEELGRLSDAAVAYQRALGAAPDNLMARVGYSRLAANLPNPAGLDSPPPGPGEASPPPAPGDVSAPPATDLNAPAPAEAPPPPPPPAPRSQSEDQ